MKKNLFEIQITVVAQGGIKFFFSKNIKISINFKNLKTKKISDSCSEAPARRSLKIIEFLESEKGTLRSIFGFFGTKK